MTHRCLGEVVVSIHQKELPVPMKQHVRKTMDILYIFQSDEWRWLKCLSEYVSSGKSFTKYQNSLRALKRTHKYSLD